MSRQCTMTRVRASEYRPPDTYLSTHGASSPTFDGHSKAAATETAHEPSMSSLPTVATYLDHRADAATVSTGDSPRIVVAGLRGDSGKSFVTLGLILSLRRLGLRVAPCKKGPDYIDAAWLAAAAGVPARNLDSFMMDATTIRRSLAAATIASDMVLVEGNRGLFDGAGAAGKHSTAELAKMLDAPIILVVDTTKSSTTIAALVLGCMHMDPDLRIAGIILNRVGTRRQERVVRQAVETTTGIPVLGALPRLESQELPSRHLGLVPTAEHKHLPETLERIADIISAHIDLAKIQDIAAATAPIPLLPKIAVQPPGGPRIGVLWDRAFSFYYPENLGRLTELGATLVPISPLADQILPEIDALYAGGGFPEVHAQQLSANKSLRTRLAREIAAGLPVWAECGGLMYLSQELTWRGATYPMVGALPLVTHQGDHPQGHGYVVARVDQPNPFLPTGTIVRGHEFHYSRVVSTSTSLPTMLALSRGSGIGTGRDGVIHGSICAFYTHVHVLATPLWAEGLLRAAQGGR